MVVVTTASMMPSGISRCAPWASVHRMAGLVIRWPTLRRNISERPCRRTRRPRQLAAGSRVWRGVDAVGFRPRVKVLPPLSNLLGQRAAWMMPSQLL